MPDDYKRNPLLNDLSEDDIHNSDSEDDLRKGSVSRKRRRDSDDGYGDDNDDKASFDSDANSDTKDAQKQPKESLRKKSAEEKLPKLSTPKPLAKKNLIATEEAIKKSGVLYISRIPPFMKPHKLRTLLEPYGAINRTFLMAEDPVAHARRVKNGGNKKKFFTEGWVEFVRKKDAKRACEMLNARTIGGKKSSYYRDDVWCMKYLTGFKWRDLMGQISAENAERASRMQAEISKAMRENKEFVRNVERAKMLDGMMTKNRRKIGAGGKVKEETVKVGGKGVEIKRQRMAFEQTKKVTKDMDAKQPESVSRVLSKIF